MGNTADTKLAAIYRRLFSFCHEIKINLRLSDCDFRTFKCRLVFKLTQNANCTCSNGCSTGRGLVSTSTQTRSSSAQVTVINIATVRSS